jgi:hypothetical protein
MQMAAYVYLVYGVAQTRYAGKLLCGWHLIFLELGQQWEALRVSRVSALGGDMNPE